VASFRRDGNAVIIVTRLVRKTAGGEPCLRGRYGLCDVRDLYSLEAFLPGEDFPARGAEVYGWPICPPRVEECVQVWK